MAKRTRSTRGACRGGKGEGGGGKSCKVVAMGNDDGNVHILTVLGGQLRRFVRQLAKDLRSVATLTLCNLGQASRTIDNDRAILTQIDYLM